MSRYCGYLILAYTTLLSPAAVADESNEIDSDNQTTSPKTELRPRLRDLGIGIGVLPTGSMNSLTDVPGVQVGHQTLVEGDSTRTGVTAIVPHSGNVFLNKVPAAIHVANGFGKFVGTTQIEELGVIETPIILTNTLSTFAAADALVGWSLQQPGCELVRSVNPVVGECNDGYLNDIRKRRIGSDDVVAALNNANSRSVREGCVGAGTGTRCMGWKGGIGSSSRKLPTTLGGYTVGVLVQTNFGGSLTVAGAPVGRELGRYYLKDEVRSQEHGSCIVIVATDAPLDARQLQRIARRAPLGLAAAGSPISHGSGDYVLAFSTAKELRTKYQHEDPKHTFSLLRDDQLSPLFQAVRDATEEAVINSVLQAVTTTGHQGRTVDAIDPDSVLEICRKHRVTLDDSSNNFIKRSSVRNYDADTLPTVLSNKIAQFEQRLPSLMKTHHVPGVSFALVFDRKLAWSRGYGVRCIGSEDPIQPDTIMEACSMSKPFFTYVLLKLVEQGHFDLETPLVNYLQADYMDDPRHRNITARMVLSHSSGLPNWRAGGWRSDSPLSLGFDPGQEFRYSGEGFLMLQRALEKSLSVPLDSLARDKLIEPLGLENTSFSWLDEFSAHAACGHDRSGQRKTNRSYYAQANCAFSLYTTAEDYARFIVEILRKDRNAEHTISTASLEQMLVPISHREEQDADWGLGWGLRMDDGRNQVYHSGSNGSGFRCYSEFYPVTGEGLVIMTNGIGGKSLWKSVIEQWHTEPQTKP